MLNELFLLKSPSTVKLPSIYSLILRISSSVSSLTLLDEGIFKAVHILEENLFPIPYIYVSPI